MEVCFRLFLHHFIFVYLECIICHLFAHMSSFWCYLPLVEHWTAGKSLVPSANLRILVWTHFFRSLTKMLNKTGPSVGPSVIPSNGTMSTDSCLS